MSSGNRRWEQGLSDLWQWSTEGKENKIWDLSPIFSRAGAEGFPEEEGAAKQLLDF